MENIRIFSKDLNQIDLPYDSIHPVLNIQRIQNSNLEQYAFISIEALFTIIKSGNDLHAQQKLIKSKI